MTGGSSSAGGPTGPSAPLAPSDTTGNIKPSKSGSKITPYVMSTDLTPDNVRLPEDTLKDYIAEFRTLRSTLAKGNLNPTELARYLVLQNQFITHNLSVITDKKITYDVNDIQHNPLGILTAVTQYKDGLVFIPKSPVVYLVSDGSSVYEPSESEDSVNMTQKGSPKESTPLYEGKGKRKASSTEDTSEYEGKGKRRSHR